MPRLAQSDVVSVIVLPLLVFREEGSKPTDYKKHHLANQALVLNDKFKGHRHSPSGRVITPGRPFPNRTVSTLENSPVIHIDEVEVGDYSER
jgi:hypothetical protein